MPGFVIHKDGALRFQNWVRVLVVKELKKNILYDGHNIPYSIDHGGKKLYKDLKQTFWWSNKETRGSRLHGKVFNLLASENGTTKNHMLLQPLEVLEWK